MQTRLAAMFRASCGPQLAQLSLPPRREEKRSLVLRRAHVRACARARASGRAGVSRLCTRVPMRVWRAHEVYGRACVLGCART
eukprot:6188253-Pleurochrysis_carterae.AAC.2